MWAAPFHELVLHRMKKEESEDAYASMNSLIIDELLPVLPGGTTAWNCDLK